MKADEKKTETQENTSENSDAWAFIVTILFLCITLIFTTRMCIDGHLLQSMVEHYTLRGRDVIVEDQQLVFIND